MSVFAIIPARWASSRFSGKPVVPLLGLPMIVHVWRRAMRAERVDSCVLATDDERIAVVARKYGMEVAMTSDQCITGTDRVAEVARQMEAEVYVNVQGDEPLLEPSGIDSIVEAHLQFVKRGIEVTNAYVPESALPFEDGAVHAFLTKTPDDRVLGLSRHPIPFHFHQKTERNSHVGMYAFSREKVIQFAELSQGPIELAEGIEMMRYMEHNIPMGCVAIGAGSKTVDNPEDVEAVENIMRAMGVTEENVHEWE
jgi:3-deoxy-manno-octulosonate cytidylyltransferase (CMP-KDO synthetase)